MPADRGGWWLVLDSCDTTAPGDDPLLTVWRLYPGDQIGCLTQG